MEAVPAIGGINEYEQPKSKEVKVEREKPEQIEAQAVQEAEKSLVKVADQDQNFKKSVIGGAYTGKGSFFDTVV